MASLRNAFRLSRRGWWLLLRCLVALTAFRLGLTLLSYNRLQTFMPTPGPEADADEAELGRVGWAIPRAARFVPMASCLTQALAAQYLLARRGVASRIRIGVTQEPDGSFLAHAWLLSGGRIVVGGTSQSLARYKFLTDLTQKSL